MASAYDELIDLAEGLIQDKVPWVDRNGRVRAAAFAANLMLREGEITAILATARANLRGGADGVGQGDVIQIAPDKWIAEKLLVKGRLNLWVALQKVGKSALLCDLLGQLIKGRGEFLERFGLYPPLNKVIIVGTDQSIEDWAEIMRPTGLMVPSDDGGLRLAPQVAKLWTASDSLRLDEGGIERIAKVCEEHRGAVLVLDSFLSLIVSLGLDENHDAAAEPIVWLMEAIQGFDITPVLIHHSAKSRAHERASNAASGRGLGRMASNVVNLHWLTESKSDDRVQLTTQGRSSKPVDLVIKQVERAKFELVGETEEVQAEVSRGVAEAGLNDKHSEALALVRDHWRTTQRPVETRHLAEWMTKTLGGNARQRALQILDSLAKKGLLVKQLSGDPKRGSVARYRPAEGGGSV